VIEKQRSRPVVSGCVWGYGSGCGSGCAQQLSKQPARAKFYAAQQRVRQRGGESPGVRTRRRSEGERARMVKVKSELCLFSVFGEVGSVFVSLGINMMQ
jgi:hypothetical protein